VAIPSNLVILGKACHAWSLCSIVFAKHHGISAVPQAFSILCSSVLANLLCNSQECCDLKELTIRSAETENRAEQEGVTQQHPSVQAQCSSTQ
jgi:hypothetical protein